MVIRGRGVRAVLLAAAVAGLGGAQLLAQNASVAAPRLVAELDRTATQRFRVWNLSWSPDERQLFVQGVAEPGNPQSPGVSFVISPSDGSSQPVATPPDWVAAYWDAKAGDSSPDGRETVIQVMGGRGGRGDVSFRLGLTKLGEVEPELGRRGYTYGWGPAGSQMVCFVDGKGALHVARQDGTSVIKVADGGFVLPAWSPSGTRIAAARERGGRWEIHLSAVTGLPAR